MTTTAGGRSSRSRDTRTALSGSSSSARSISR
ncbi:hypothetical protein [Mycobacterium phage Maco2]|uniref:Uncharacterized protein n=1 Tax=Mycobacterium phage Maco2 TaxID=2805749 RepID=A0A899IM83_9CAUD|nr:hypothetical protein [Mycobacterium phage Maco2]